MKKKDNNIPKLGLYSPQDFSNYSYNTAYEKFNTLLRTYDVSKPSRSNLGKTNAITLASSVGLTTLFLACGGAWYLFWVPICASLAGGMILDRTLMVSIPKSRLKKAIREDEIEKERERLEAMQPPTFDIAYIRNQIDKWKDIETPSFIKKAYKTMLVDLTELVNVIEENELDLDRWTSLFKRYIPDIVDVVKEYESYDDVTDKALIALFNEMSGYLNSEIQYAKMGKRVDHAATIKAYTTYFSGQTNDKRMGGV